MGRQYRSPAAFLISGFFDPKSYVGFHLWDTIYGSAPILGPAFNNTARRVKFGKAFLIARPEYRKRMMDKK
jgi:hypothetical protein